MTLFNDANPLAQKLKNIKPDELTPRQALDLVFELTHLIREMKG
jgi:hypothetical protein